jgi:hypothetical protein
MGGGFEFIVKSIVTGATRTISIAGAGQSSSVLAEFHVDWPCRIIGFETSPGDTYDLQPTVTSVQTDCTTADDVVDDDDDYDDDDDDFAPNTCADVQEWLSTGECADGPSVCRAEYDAWVVCHYEDMAQEELGQACDFTCSPDKKLSRDNSMQLFILIVFCSVVGICCLLAISTAIIYAFGGFCFAKRKKMPARVPEPSSSAASAPIPLAVAEYVAEASPSPGPPPLAPIKATETLAPEMP